MRLYPINSLEQRSEVRMDNRDGQSIAYRRS